MPKFSGASKDNFESWILNSKEYLENFPRKAKNDRLRALKLSLSGPARQVLEGYAPIKSVRTVYKVLEKTYGIDGNKFNRLVDTKQQPEESVRAFLARLRTNMMATNVLDKKSQKEAGLSLFLQNVKPDIGKRLAALFPSTLKQATEMAIKIEKEFKLRDSKNREKVQAIVDEEKSQSQNNKLGLKELIRTEVKSDLQNVANQLQNTLEKQLNAILNNIAIKIKILDLVVVNHIIIQMVLNSFSKITVHLYVFTVRKTVIPIVIALWPLKMIKEKSMITYQNT